jgi:hypothetical protein
MANNNKFNPVKTGSPVTGSLVSTPMNIRTQTMDAEKRMPGERDNEHARQHLTMRASMTSGCSSEIFTVPAKVFELLDPLEKIIIRRQAERGEIRIADAPTEREEQRGEQR